MSDKYVSYSVRNMNKIKSIDDLYQQFIDNKINCLADLGAGIIYYQLKNRYGYGKIVLNRKQIEISLFTDQSYFDRIAEEYKISREDGRYGELEQYSDGYGSNLAIVANLLENRYTF